MNTLQDLRSARLLCRATASLILLLASLAPAPGMAEDIRIEAEAYTALDGAGLAMMVVTDSHASGNLALDGFTRPGAWAEYVLALPDPLCFVTRVRSAGAFNLVRAYEITFSRAGEVIASASMVTPPGSGVG